MFVGFTVVSRKFRHIPDYRIETKGGSTRDIKDLNFSFDNKFFEA
jgi:hypothetical protein